MLRHAKEWFPFLWFLLYFLLRFDFEFSNFSSLFSSDNPVSLSRLICTPAAVSLLFAQDAICVFFIFSKSFSILQASSFSLRNFLEISGCPSFTLDKSSMRQTWITKNFICLSREVDLAARKVSRRPVIFNPDYEYSSFSLSGF